MIAVFNSFNFGNRKQGEQTVKTKGDEALTGHRLFSPASSTKADK